MPLVEFELRPDDDSYTFQTRFLIVATKLEPDQRIRLKVTCECASNIELLEDLLHDDDAVCKIAALCWVYEGVQDVCTIIPLLVDHCTELTSLQVQFGGHSAFDFISSVLERPGNAIQMLKLPPRAYGDAGRFFNALEHSHVSTLIFSSVVGPRTFYDDLCAFLAKDLLTKLVLYAPPTKVVWSLSKCVRLHTLTLLDCVFSEPTTLMRLPKSITAFSMRLCVFDCKLDWSFLENSGIQVLYFDNIDYETLWNANDMMKCLTLALHRQDSKMQKLVLGRVRMNQRFEHAVKHPNCVLTELALIPFRSSDITAAAAIRDGLYVRRRAFSLLYGQQVRHVYCPLQRLPIEMFRMVGALLM